MKNAFAVGRRKKFGVETQSMRVPISLISEVEIFIHQKLMELGLSDEADRKLGEALGRELGKPTLDISGMRTRKWNQVVYVSTDDLATKYRIIHQQDLLITDPEKPS